MNNNVKTIDRNMLDKIIYFLKVLKRMIGYGPKCDEIDKLINDLNNRNK